MVTTSSCFSHSNRGDRLRRFIGGEANRSQEGGDGEVCEKSLEMKHFRVFSYPEEAEGALAWAARAAGDRRMKRTASTKALGCRIEADQDP